MYGKIFDSIYDGTLVEDWRALITFQQMIVLSDADGVVDMTASAISRRTSIPIEHIKAGLEILEQPDPESRTPDEDGRRIVRLDDHKTWGWYLVNHNKYKGLQDSDTVREQNRIRKQRQREKQKESRNVTDGHAPSRHTDTDTDTTNNSLFLTFWDLYPRKAGSKKKAQTSFNNLTKTKQKLAIEDIATRYRETEKKFIPYATTYLNGAMWEGERESVSIGDEIKWK